MGSVQDWTPINEYKRPQTIMMQQAFGIFLGLLIVSAFTQWNVEAQGVYLPQGNYPLQGCQCTEVTALANTGANIGRCFTQDRFGRFFCYVNPNVGRGRACCEDSSARYPALCVSFSLCSGVDAEDSAVYYSTAKVEESTGK